MEGSVPEPPPKHQKPIGKPSSRFYGKNNGYDGESYREGECSGEVFEDKSIDVEIFLKKIKSTIKYFRENRKSCKNRNLVIIKKSDKLVEALNLPKIMNINPRSAMNKLEELKMFIEEEEIDCAFISESHDRENKRLDENLKIDNFTVISNLYQRKEKGGRPALVINNSKFTVKNLTNTDIQIPWGVEVTWAILTPKNVATNSIVQNIVLGCIYSKPNSKKKRELNDHIAETYNFLNYKYGKGLYWMLAGDTNDFKLDKVLKLSPNFQSVVKSPTRLNPDKILDNIVTDMSKWYQMPKCLPALEADTGSGGKPSDHLTVVMEPISVLNNRPARVTREVEVRPLTQTGLDMFGAWIKNQNWNEVIDTKTCDEKAEVFQNMLLKKLTLFRVGGRGHICPP